MRASASEGKKIRHSLASPSRHQGRRPAHKTTRPPISATAVPRASRHTKTGTTPTERAKIRRPAFLMPGNWLANLLSKIAARLHCTLQQTSTPRGCHPGRAQHHESQNIQHQENAGKIRAQSREAVERHNGLGNPENPESR